MSKDNRTEPERIAERDELLTSMEFEAFFAERIEFCARNHAMVSHKENGKQKAAIPAELSTMGAYLSYKSSKRQEQLQIEQAASSKRFARWSIGLIVFSILLSATVIYFSNSWQAEQIPILHDICNNLQTEYSYGNPPSTSAPPAESYLGNLRQIVENTKPAKPAKHIAEPVGLVHVKNRTPTTQPAKEQK